MKILIALLYVIGSGLASAGNAADLPSGLDAAKSEAISRVVRAIKDERTASTAICNGRLTLSSGTAIPTSNVTAATSVYFTPFNGAEVAVYSGAVWQLIRFAETSVAVPATTTTPFDIFAYSNSGVLALETVNWTNDTTRATSLTTQNGTLVKSGDTTRRYLGTARTTGVSGQTEDSSSKRFLWNMCNRVPRSLLAQSSLDSWSYTTATWREANGSTTTGATRVEWVLGQQFEPLKLKVFVPCAANTNSTISGIDGAVGIGIGDTTTNSADLYGGAAGGYSHCSISRAGYSGFPGVGYKYGQWIEISVATSTTTWRTSTQSGGTQRQGGMEGVIWQ